MRAMVRWAPWWCCCSGSISRPSSCSSAPSSTPSSKAACGTRASVASTGDSRGPRKRNQAIERKTGAKKSGFRAVSEPADVRPGVRPVSGCLVELFEIAVEMLQIAPIDIMRPGRHVTAVQHVLELGACARDTALHRADRAAGELRRMIIGIAVGADEHERFAL